ncbi:MAG TPA: TonB-dependent receptor, partial [Blastocatellia bacterium]
MYGKYIAAIIAALMSLVLCAAAFPAQQGYGSIRGQISDELGGVIVNAEVALTGPNGERLTSRTDKAGVYVFNAVAAGKYTLLAQANGFVSHQQPVEVSASAREILDIKLRVALGGEKEVTVTDAASVNTDPDSNASAIVLRDKDLDRLPDDPDELAAALQALAGPSAGPGGGQLYVDGFTLEGRVPPKNSIKEVRINQNPFTAEFDRLGFGRIFITTRPGTNQYHGTAMFHFNDEALNSRNAFAPERAPFQLRYYTFDASGPLAGNRSSFFTNFQRREIDDNAVINAITLNPNLDISPLRATALAPRREIFFSARADYQINQNNSLLGHYVYTPASVKNSSVGDFSLLSRAINREEDSHVIRLTNTSILSATTANETRFQYVFLRRNLQGDGAQPAITALDAFIGGGASYSRAAFDVDAWEIHNYTTRTIRSHTLRFGGRFRSATYRDFSPANFAGTYTFAGGLAPELDGANRVKLDSNNEPISVQISSIERYRRTLLFQRQGLSPAEIRALGGGATQFSIAGGNPEIKATQRDAGIFLQDDWRVRDNFTFSAGLRYENQNNISSNLNFAPRLGFAWTPGKAGGKQVIRGGIGVFYDRIPLQLTMTARRFDGVNQRQFIVSDPEILGLFPLAPSIETLAQFALPQTVRRMADDARAPYFTQASLSFERQLPGNAVFTATYI